MGLALLHGEVIPGAHFQVLTETLCHAISLRSPSRFAGRAMGLALLHGEVMPESHSISKCSLRDSGIPFFPVRQVAS